MFKFRFKNSDNLDANFSSISIEAIITINMFCLIVPIVTIKQYNHSNGCNVGIGNESPKFILLDIIESHCVKQRVAKSLKVIFSRIFNGTFQRTTLCFLGIRWLYFFLYSAKSAGYSNALTFFVLAKTLLRTKIMLANSRMDSINYCPAKVTWDILACLSLFTARLCCISRSTYTGTIVPLAISNKIILLIKFLVAIITINHDTIKSWVSTTHSSCSPAITRTEHKRCRAFASTLKLNATIFANECFYNLIPCTQSLILALARTIYGFSVCVSCKFSETILANKSFNHADSITRGRTFCNA